VSKLALDVPDLVRDREWRVEIHNPPPVAAVEVECAPLGLSDSLELLLMTTSPLYDIDAKTIDGENRSLAAYRGKTLLIVNVASGCGFTPQYTGLEALYRKYKDQGLVVLGFPCNQFGHQEPGSEAEIQQFCTTSYDVTFPLFAKVEVNGSGTHPLYEKLKSARPGVLGTEAIKWNFTKFLVNARGEVVARYAPSDTPEKIEQAVAAQLVGGSG
jgi:glutathione peroxidase